MIKNQSYQAATKHPAMIALCTGKNRLELVQHVIYRGRDSRAMPHVLGSCLILGLGNLQNTQEPLVFNPFFGIETPEQGDITRHF